jgi:hypothetical protein
MENFDYYPDEDFDFDPTFELQNQASGSLDTPHKTSTIKKLPGTQTTLSFSTNSSKNIRKDEISNNKTIVLIYLHFY